MTKTNTASTKKPETKRMPEQLPFEYQIESANGIIESEANQHVIDALRRKTWPTGRVAVIGDAYAGKSHLAYQLIGAGAAALGTADDTIKLMSGAQAPLLVLDNFDDFIAKDGAEEAFFHLLNRTAESGQKVAIFSQVPLGEITIALPDLRSRMSTFESYTINPPDDQLMRQLIAKGFEARGLYVKPDVIRYLAERLERSYGAVHEAVLALDAMALKAQGKVNKARVRDYLETRADAS